MFKHAVVATNDAASWSCVRGVPRAAKAFWTRLASWRQGRTDTVIPTVGPGKQSPLDMRALASPETPTDLAARAPDLHHRRQGPDHHADRDRIFRKEDYPGRVRRTMDCG